MTAEILICPKCNKFTLKEECNCGIKTITVRPAKWSPEDKWGEYRRAYKQRIPNEGN